MSDSSTAQPNPPNNSDRIIRSLLVVDSAIRNGQFLYAHRENQKLLSEILRCEYGDDHSRFDELVSSIKMTSLLLKPIIRMYSQNRTSLDIARRTLGWQNKSPKAQPNQS